ncbi:YdcF family protein [Pseudoalteromonas phenolica]|uniref:YdcF family protein n=1 Tax=Pseudoalteromonas phenolica TaxID=161398 RepID=A0A5S3YYE5_9GAMM|nr:YdcF family protein [Pseudoalteromonas phenolica]TMP83784.1 YdcF family protein [Pseudoalteromonas phenolica]
MLKAIILLGGPNNAQGELSEIVKSRCKTTFEYHLNYPELKILCTGGFGAHFNVTEQAHADYVKAYLTALGVPDTQFLPIAESRFTLEDALLAKPILKQAAISEVVLITSSFHMKRAKYIFNRLCPELLLECVEAPTPVCDHELEKLLAHEVKALQREAENIDTLLASADTNAQ